MGTGPKAVWGGVYEFPEICPDFLVEDKWHEVLCGQWQYPEAIHVLEGRVGLMAARRTLRKLENRDGRHLLLSDNMSFILAMSKGRATDYSLLLLC
eukprot:5543847-Heterocapsa_arctica.AAC.1